MSDATIPPGFCQCGCGARTTVVQRNKRGMVKGEFYKYVSGHNPNSKRSKSFAIQRNEDLKRGSRWDKKCKPSHTFTPFRGDDGTIQSFVQFIAETGNGDFEEKPPGFIERRYPQIAWLRGA